MIMSFCVRACDKLMNFTWNFRIVKFQGILCVHVCARNSLSSCYFLIPLDHCHRCNANHFCCLAVFEHYVSVRMEFLSKNRRMILFLKCRYSSSVYQSNFCFTSEVIYQ